MDVAPDVAGAKLAWSAKRSCFRCPFSRLPPTKITPLMANSQAKKKCQLRATARLRGPGRVTAAGKPRGNDRPLEKEGSNTPVVTNVAPPPTWKCAPPGRRRPRQPSWQNHGASNREAWPQ